MTRTRPARVLKSKKEPNRKMKLGMIFIGILCLGFSAAGQGSNTAASASAKPLYQNNFEKAALNGVPEEMLVLDGAFAVKEEGGNKFLELPGAPLDTFGILCGPTEKAGIAVSARIFGTAK